MHIRTIINVFRLWGVMGLLIPSPKCVHLIVMRIKPMFHLGRILIKCVFKFVPVIKIFMEILLLGFVFQVVID